MPVSVEDREDDLHRHVARCAQCWDARHVTRADQLPAERMCEWGTQLSRLLVQAILERDA